MWIVVIGVGVVGGIFVVLFDWVGYDVEVIVCGDNFVVIK